MLCPSPPDVPVRCTLFAPAFSNGRISRVAMRGSFCLPGEEVTAQADRISFLPVTLKAQKGRQTQCARMTVEKPAQWVIKPCQGLAGGGGQG